MGSVSLAALLVSVCLGTDAGILAGEVCLRWWPAAQCRMRFPSFLYLTMLERARQYHSPREKTARRVAGHRHRAPPSHSRLLSSCETRTPQDPYSTHLFVHIAFIGDRNTSISTFERTEQMKLFAAHRLAVVRSGAFGSDAARAAAAMEISHTSWNDDRLSWGVSASCD